MWPRTTAITAATDARMPMAEQRARAIGDRDGRQPGGFTGAIAPRSTED
jgi:hypothetical protein